MTGGAFTPRAQKLLDRLERAHRKPFEPELLRTLVSQRLERR